jgi:hypothetical protein
MCDKLVNKLSIHFQICKHFVHGTNLFVCLVPNAISTMVPEVLAAINVMYIVYSDDLLHLPQKVHGKSTVSLGYI